jgi:hypothetical protein
VGGRRRCRSCRSTHRSRPGRHVGQGQVARDVVGGAQILHSTTVQQRRHTAADPSAADPSTLARTRSPATLLRLHPTPNNFKPLPPNTRPPCPPPRCGTRRLFSAPRSQSDKLANLDALAKLLHQNFSSPPFSHAAGLGRSNSALQLTFSNFFRYWMCFHTRYNISETYRVASTTWQRFARFHRFGIGHTMDLLYSKMTKSTCRAIGPGHCHTLDGVFLA